MEIKIVLDVGKQRVYLYPEKDHLRIAVHDETPTHKIKLRPTKEEQVAWETVLKALNVNVAIDKDTHLSAHVLKK